jgi:hypothetical protein
VTQRPRSPIHIDGLDSGFVVGKGTRLAVLIEDSEILYPKVIARTDLDARKFNRGV